MKKCNTCNAVYDESYLTCPTCGGQLVSLTANSNSSEQDEHQFIGDINSRVNNGIRGATVYTENAYRFMEQDGSSVVFNGAIAETSTQQFYQSRFTKIIRALFSSEPYQLSYTSYITVFRVEEHTVNRYPEQAQDIVLFGGVQNVFAPGDDVTVRTKRQGNRFVAKSIYNHSINSNVRMEGNIPASVIKLLFLVLAMALFWIVYSIATVNYAAVGQALLQFIISLVPAILTVVILWYLIKAFFGK